MKSQIPSFCAVSLAVTLFLSAGCGGNDSGDSPKVTKKARQEAAIEAYVEPPGEYVKMADPVDNPNPSDPVANLKLPDVQPIFDAVEAFNKQNGGKDPKNPQELVAAGLLPPLPVLPAGYSYILDLRAMQIRIVTGQ